MVIKIIKIIIFIIFILGGVFTLLSPLSFPRWSEMVLDSLHPERFVTLALYRGQPFIAYFDAKNEGGVLLFRPKSTGYPLLDDLKLYFQNFQREWEKETIDQRKYTGLFLTGANNDQLHLAYQDGTLGKEKLLYASFDGQTWQKEVVDEARLSGINVGMYAALALFQNQPIIFYHTEQGKKFGYARKISGQVKTANQSFQEKTASFSSQSSTASGKTPSFWEKKTLETGVGWLTAAAACPDRVFAVYRSRDFPTLYLGTLYNDYNDYKNYKWSSRPLEASTSSSLALAAALRPSSGRESFCLPYLAYFAEEKGEVRFLDLTRQTAVVVGRGRPAARVSLVFAADRFYLLYPAQEGLILAQSQDGKRWEKEILEEKISTGVYPALAVSGSGDIFLAFIDKNFLKYKEYNQSSIYSLQKIKTITSYVFWALGFFWLVLGFKPKFSLQKPKRERKIKKK